MAIGGSGWQDLLMRPPMPSTPVTIHTFSPFSLILNSWESASKDGISYELRFSSDSILNPSEFILFQLSNYASTYMYI